MNTKLKQTKQLQASTSELFEAFYTLVQDEVDNEGVEATPNEVASMAKQLTYNLSVQDALLSEANAIVKRSKQPELIEA